MSTPPPTCRRCAMHCGRCPNRHPGSGHLPPGCTNRPSRTYPMHDTWPLLRDSAFPPIARDRLDTLQLNLGYLCNLSCIHCHVNAGPRRTELMDRDTMTLALKVAQRHGVGILDVTGGSPEMNPDFRWLVIQARDAGLHVMD